MREALLKKRYGIPAALLLILVVVGLASAAIYWTGTQTLSQTIKEVGTIKTSAITLPNINETRTATYDENTHTGGNTELDRALTITVSEQPKTLSVDFTNTSAIDGLYDAYELKVIVDNTSVTSGILPAGKAALTVSLSTTTPQTVELGATGKWIFDYEVSVTAKGVTADTTKDAIFEFKVKD